MIETNMKTRTPPVKEISNARLWTAGAMRGIVILFMLFDGIGKFTKPVPVVEGTATLGFAEHHLVTLGVLVLLCTVLYAIPRTWFLGALLLTGYLGGAVATHLRLDNPLWSHLLFPVYVAILAWGALWLVDRRLRNLLWERE
ncbi:DoxX family protein [Paenibacillus agricola]|nr:DoxX family protein [Paenibacillus agricola]